MNLVDEIVKVHRESQKTQENSFVERFTLACSDLAKKTSEDLFLEVKELSLLPQNRKDDYLNMKMRFAPLEVI